MNEKHIFAAHRNSHFEIIHKKTFLMSCVSCLVWKESHTPTSYLEYAGHREGEPKIFPKRGLSYNNKSIELGVFSSFSVGFTIFGEREKFFFAFSLRVKIEHSRRGEKNLNQILFKLAWKFIISSQQVLCN